MIFYLLSIIKRLNWDRFGKGLSFICLLHCLFVPFLLLFMKFIDVQKFEFGSFEFIIIILSACMAILTSLRNYFLHHTNLFVLLLFVSAFLLFLMGSFILPSYKLILHILAATILMTTHIYNEWRCRNCQHTHQ